MTSEELKTKLETIKFKSPYIKLHFITENPRFSYLVIDYCKDNESIICLRLNYPSDITEIPLSDIKGTIINKPKSTMIDKNLEVLMKEGFVLFD